MADRLRLRAAVARSTRGSGRELRDEPFDGRAVVSPQRRCEAGCDAAHAGQGGELCLVGGAEERGRRDALERLVGAGDAEGVGVERACLGGGALRRGELPPEGDVRLRERDQCLLGGGEVGGGAAQLAGGRQLEVDEPKEQPVEAQCLLGRLERREAGAQEGDRLFGARQRGQLTRRGAGAEREGAVGLVDA